MQGATAALHSLFIFPWKAFEPALSYRVSFTLSSSTQAESFCYDKAPRSFLSSTIDGGSTSSYSAVASNIYPDARSLIYAKAY